MSLTLEIMGPPLIHVDGTPLDVDTRKAIALLVYLAIEGDRQPRDHLVELLWPDSDPQRSRSSLRRTLSTLRTALDGNWVDADRSFVVLDRTGVTTDLAQFRALTANHLHDEGRRCPQCIDELEQARTLNRGEFLAGFVLRDAGPFENWALAVGEQVRREVEDMLDRLTSALAADGDYETAIARAEERLALDPLREDAHRSLMLLHAWSGDRSGAVDAFRRLVATLDEELGVPPLEETTELYEAILEEDLPRAPAPRRSPLPAPPATELPFVGRDAELIATRDALDAGRVVLVEAQFGAGTSAFLSEVAGALTDSGFTVLKAAGTPGAVDIPYGVVHEALFPVTRDEELLPIVEALPSGVLGELGRIFPALGRPDEDDAEPATRTRLLDALARMVEVLPDPVLIIDDSQWCDPASLEAVAFLAARGERLGLRIALATDADEAVTAPESPAVTDLRMRAETVRLAPLSVADVAALVKASGVDLSPDDLALRTGGLPLLVVETIGAIARGDSDAIPDQVRRALSSRLAGLSGTAAQVLDAVAVLEVEADAPLVAEVSGRSPDETDAALEELLGRGLVREVDDRTVATHGQLADLVASRHSAARRRLLNRRAAVALEARGYEPARIARHRLAAGEDDLAAEWYATAGADAVAVFAYAEAISHFEAALAAGHPDRAWLHRSIADAAMRDGLYGGALTAFEAALAAGGPDPVIEHSLGEIHRRLRRWDLAAAHYDRAFAEGDDPRFLAIVAADRAYVEHRRDDDGEASRWLNRALSLAADGGSETAGARAHNVAGIVSDDAGERLSHLERALELATRPVERVAVLNNLAREALGAGRTDEAVTRARDAVELARSFGDRHLLAAVYNNLADALHSAGEREESMRALTEAVTRFAEITTDAETSWEPEVWLLTEW